MTVIVPLSTSAMMIGRMRAFGAEVRVHGAAWDDANEEALKIAAQPGAFLFLYSNNAI